MLKLVSILSAVWLPSAYNENMKFRVYVETSVISYLTARPSRDLSIAARQQSSLELWESQDRYELVVSDLVLSEAAAGDAGAALARHARMNDLLVLPVDDDAQAVADALVARDAMPAAAYADALHIGIAASHQIE